MRLRLTRDVFLPGATLSHLAITYDGPLAYGKGGWQPANPHGPLDAFYVCEDVDRGLDAAMPLAELKAKKVKTATAIPVGTYRVMFTWSPKYKRTVLQLLAVPAFGGIRIHSGNNAGHTEGCLLSGTARDTTAGTVLHSKPAVAWLESRVRECEARGEVTEITICRDEPAWLAFLQ